MDALLKKLRIQAQNPGACYGANGWLSGSGSRLVSYNPTTGESIAAVTQATAVEYYAVVTSAERAFATWRTTRAPRRGQGVRDLGNALSE